jgi:hypothetical protein
MSISESDLQLKYKSMLGLNNVNNTSDADKPLSLAVKNALNGKLGLTGGTLTGGLTGTTGTFSNDVISNTSGYTGGISMLSLYNNLQSLKSQISSFSTNTIYITTESNFPIKIPYSYTTIDQISNSSGTTGSTKSPYYICLGHYRPVAMTSINADYGFFGAWGIKRSAVDRAVWQNDWTFITKLWFDPSATTGTSTPNKCDRIVVKFGEKWDRWDNGSEGVNNRGDQGTTGADSTDPKENIYLMINNPSGPSTTGTTSPLAAMNITINNYASLAPYWQAFPDSIVNNFNGGVYIIISYTKITGVIKIDFCVASSGTKIAAGSIGAGQTMPNTMNVISHISATTTTIDPLINDRRPFHIYVNGGIPYWFFGMVLFKNSNLGITDYILQYKNQFLIAY